MSSWEKVLLASAKEFCLDAAHKTTNVEKCLLYTIVIKHPQTETGCPPSSSLFYQGSFYQAHRRVS
ncbi:hypothetical protein BDB01DRAFT_809528 [Pilobolus umbonatus]|nr:hypothetical protein BDB01DRAFT_809528 [Pilobolus umbonatus]